MWGLSTSTKNALWVYIKLRKLSIHTLLHFPFCRGLGYKRAFVPVGCHTIWLLKWLVRKTKPIIPRDRITAGVAQWLSFLFRVMDAQQLNFAALYVSSWAKYIWSTTIKKLKPLFCILPVHVCLYILLSISEVNHYYIQFG